MLRMCGVALVLVAVKAEYAELAVEILDVGSEVVSEDYLPYSRRRRPPRHRVEVPRNSAG